jgi:hypothetical protein
LLIEPNLAYVLLRSQVSWVIGELAFEYWAGVILIADIGFLTPVSVFNVPDIKLPMHVGETSEMACAKVSKAPRLYGRPSTTGATSIRHDAQEIRSAILCLLRRVRMYLQFL